jgi:lincosamide nucleotidyltransferase A/C/D/E
MDKKKFPDFKLKSELRMPAEKVVELYKLFEDNGVQIWVDGGWGVDALLEEQTREHADLDVALDHIHEGKMRDLLGRHDYKVVQTNDKTDWNYVLGDGRHLIDVHIFGFDKAGNNTYGTKYPIDSLTGSGKINDVKVRCISPLWMLQFKSHPKQSQVDRFDQKRLCEKFSLPIPPIYKP